MRSIRTKLLVAFLLLGFLASAAGGGVILHRFQSSLLDQIRTDLTEAVRLVSSLLDPEVILRGVDTAFSEDPAFRQNILRLRAIKSSLGLTYVYTLVPTEQGEFRFSLDGTDEFAWDQVPDFKPEENVQGTMYADIPQGALRAWRENRTVFQDEFYTDSWGTYLSVFTPYPGNPEPPQYLIGADLNVEGVLGRLNEAWFTFAAAMALSLLVSAVSALVLSTSLSRPLVELTRAAERLSQKDFSVVIQTSPRQDEIGRLARAYQVMKSELEHYTLHLQDLVAARTAELETANAALRRRQEEMERELRLAQRLQRNILPNERTYPNRDEMEFGSVYRSLAAVGGDFFDIIRSGRNQYGVLIADVSGHGVPAALVTTMAKVSFHSNSGYNVLPGEVLERVNADLLMLLGDDFSHYLTAFYALMDLETSTLYYGNAGHHPPVLVRSSSEELLRLGKPFPFLGYIPHPKYETESITLRKGDTLVLFTDGIIETMNPNQEQYDEERLLDYLRSHAKVHPRELAEGLIRDVEHFSQGMEPTDDRAVLVVRYLGEHRLEIESSHSSRVELTELQERLREAVALVRERRWTEAQPILAELCERHPHHPKLVSHYAYVLSRLGKTLEARRLIQATIDRVGDHPDLREIQRLIERQGRKT